MTKAAVPPAKAAASLFSPDPVGVADPDYNPVTGPAENPYIDVDARRKARETAFFDQAILNEDRPGGPLALQLAAPPVAEGLQQLLLEGKSDRILEEAGKDPKGKALAAVTLAEDNGQPVLLAALLGLSPVRNQLSKRLQIFVPDAIRLLLDDRDLSERDAGDALRQLLQANTGFRPSAREALGERWSAAHARLDSDGVGRLAKIADLAGLASALPAIDPLAALRNETASVEQIVRWIDKTDSDSTRALQEAVPAFVRDVIAERHGSGTLPAAADTALTLLHDGRHGDAKALLKLLHAAGVPLPTRKFLHAINEAKEARKLDESDVVPMLSAALGANLVEDIDQPLASADPQDSGGTTALDLLMKEGALALVAAVVKSGARIDADVLQRCTSAPAVQPLRALYLGLGGGLNACKVIQEALRATPQVWLGIVDALLSPLDDPGDAQLVNRASMLYEFQQSDSTPGLRTSLSNTGVSGEQRVARLLRFPSRVARHDRRLAMLLTMNVGGYLYTAHGLRAAALALDEALREGSWRDAAFLCFAETNVDRTREMAARAIAGGATPGDVAILLDSVRSRHADRNPLVRFFLFLRYGWNAWSKQPVKVAERHTTIVELLKKRKLNLASLLRLRAAQ